MCPTTEPHRRSQVRQDHLAEPANEAERVPAEDPEDHAVHAHLAQCPDPGQAPRRGADDAEAVREVVGEAELVGERVVGPSALTCAWVW